LNGINKVNIDNNKLIDEKEFRDALKKCSMKSSSGISGFGYEHINKLFDIMKDEILDMYNNFMRDGIASECWNKMRMIPLFKRNKKDANKYNPNSFRPICLAENAFKILETLWINRMYPILHYESGENQFA